MLTLHPENYVFHEEDGVYARPERPPFPCPERAAPVDHLWNIVNSARDRSTASKELLAAAGDWPSRYHLSPYRANLLRPFASLLQESVLEIGCGCGAITRFLGERSSDVAAVEGDWSRARIAAARCAGLPGVRVYCEDFRDLSLDRQFQAVICTGALRRSPMHFTGPDPAGQMLRRLAAHLAPGGYLIFAVENRLSLHSFASPEDDSDRRFESFEDPEIPLRLGKREWEQRLRNHGLEAVSFWYPFPDYKLPGLLVSSAAFEEEWLNLGSLVRGFRVPHRGRPHSRVFPEAMAWPVLVNNGLAEDLANSFLILARLAGNTAPHWEPGSILYHYSTNRLPAYAVEISLSGAASDARVCRRRVFPGEPRDPRYCQTLRDEPYISGELFADDVYGLLNRPGWTLEELAHWAGPWVNHLRAWSYSESGGPVLLPPNFLDYTPFNLVRRPDGTLSVFDLEYAPEKPVLLDYVVFRGLWATLFRTGVCAGPAAPLPPALADLVIAVMRLLGFTVSPEDRDRFVQEEARLQSAVTGVPVHQAELNIAAASLEIHAASGKPPDPLSAQLYWRNSDQDAFSETESFPLQLPVFPPRRILRFPFPAGLPRTAQFRLDLANHAGLASIFAIRILTSGDSLAWEWNGEAAALSAAVLCGMNVLVRPGCPNVLVHLCDNDPQFLLPVTEEVFERLQDGGIVEVDFSWLGALSSPGGPPRI